MITYSKLGRMGRFANGMFEIAGTIGIAVKSNQNFGFPKWRNYDALERFGSTEDIDLYKYFVNDLPEVPEGIPFEEHPYFWGYRDIRLPQGNWNLNGHFQSDKYFNHCIETIRYYFTMFDEVAHDATAIHMRFGDYDDNYHPIQKIEYYRQALVHVPGPYYLFSDNLDEAHKIMTELRVNYIPIENDYIESFKIMKNCNHFICGNSSYSLMAAILSPNPGKIVVCPKKWFGDHVELETADLYPTWSIII